MQEALRHAIYRKTNSANEEAKELLMLFRKCEPDEFGFINKRSFDRGVRAVFPFIGKKDTRRLFRIGDIDGRGELNYHAFRKVFAPVDNVAEYFEPFNPGRKKVEPEEGMDRCPDPSKQLMLGGMSKNFEAMSLARIECSPNAPEH